MGGLFNTLRLESIVSTPLCGEYSGLVGFLHEKAALLRLE